MGHLKLLKILGNKKKHVSSFVIVFGINKKYCLFYQFKYLNIGLKQGLC